MILAAAYGAIDFVETLSTTLAFGCSLDPFDYYCDFNLGAGQAGAIHLLSDLKWVLLIANLAAVALLFLWSRENGAWSWQRSAVTRRVKADPNTDPNDVPSGPAPGLFALVGLFAVLVAVPAGGALDQMPDVLRAQHDAFGGWDHPGHAYWSVAALVVFGLVVWFVAQVGTRGAERTSVSSSNVVKAAVGMTAALAGFYLLVGEPFDLKAMLPVLAPFLVIGVLAAAAKLFDWVTRDAAPDGGDDGADADVGELDEEIDERSLVDVLQELVVRLPEGSDERADAETAHLLAAEAAERARPYDLVARARILTAGLVALIALTASLGAIRALIPVALVGTSSTSETKALLWVSAGLAVMVTPIIARFVYSRHVSSPHMQHMAAPVRVAGLALCGAVAVAAVCLAINPENAIPFGAPATIAILLAAYAVLVGGVDLLSRKFRWDDLKHLRFGPRTPWLAFLVIMLMAAGALDTRGGYHDTRTVTSDRGLRRRGRASSPRGTHGPNSGSRPT